MEGYVLWNILWQHTVLNMQRNVSKITVRNRIILQLNIQHYALRTLHSTISVYSNSSWIRWKSWYILTVLFTLHQIVTHLSKWNLLELTIFVFNKWPIGLDQEVNLILYSHIFSVWLKGTALTCFTFLTCITQAAQQSCVVCWWVMRSWRWVDAGWLKWIMSSLRAAWTQHSKRALYLWTSDDMAKMVRVWKLFVSLLHCPLCVNSIISPA